LWCRWGLFPPATALSNICLSPAHSPHKHRQRQIRTSLDVEALWAVRAEIAPRHSPADPPQKIPSIPTVREFSRIQQYSSNCKQNARTRLHPLNYFKAI
jgi:hypothetical protein